MRQGINWWRNHLVSFQLRSLQLGLIERIQVCPRGRYLILLDSLSSLMAMRPRKITCKAHVWVYESKKIYWDFQQLNYNVKLMWISSQVGIYGWPDRWGRHRPRTNEGGQWPQDISYTSNSKAAATRLEDRIHCLETEEKSFTTTILRVMSNHCSIWAHLERFKIVGDPIWIMRQ
jgi:hypothetical protein